MRNRGIFSAFGAIVAAMTVGCSAIVGITDVPNPAAGTGGTGGGDDASVPRYLGNWTTNDGGKETITCGPGMGADVPLMKATLVITRAAPGQISANTGGCVILANVTGNIGTIIGHQMCSLSTDMETDVYTYSGGTFTLSADGRMASLNASGSVFVMLPNRQVTCDFTLAQTFTKTG